MTNSRTKREIPKLPIVPNLSEQSIKLLTELCFREDNIKKCDAILVFGTSIGIDETIRSIINLLDAEISNNVIITGGMPNYEKSINLKEPESETIFKLFKNYNLSKKINFFLEKKSTNTYENVYFSIPYLQELKIKSLLFSSRSYAAGRNYLTIRKLLPEIQIYCASYSLFINGNPNESIRSDNWFNFLEGRQRVWGEFLRIKAYGQREHLYFDEVKENIKKISDLVFNNVL